MRIEKSQVTKLVITDVPHLDSLHVFIEDLSEREGKITMETSSECWSAYWGGCGSKGVVEFFLGCNSSYLVNCFDRGISSTINDYDNLDKWFKKAICKLRREFDYSQDEAREQWDTVGIYCHNDESFLHSDKGQELAQEIIGDEWWYCLPETKNGSYVYLERVVLALREALLEINKEV